ncbi:biosynthetic-type acetolactate synthase large subunit [Blautia sp. HCP3S3_H10_1]|uniref:biosynthetic-type acetolactate synthase large subunit n=1 Tax=unclassified Blautia TaxID=2648079 RepID=UPI003F92C307
MQLTGAEIIIECLLEQSVDTVFGYPGGAILNVYDALYRYSDKIKHVLTSHEQGASHAADGYARATGKVGVCLATSGPGATNLVTGIATACMDSVPVVAITCNVGTALLGKDSFQEVDIAGIVMPVTKHSYIVKDVTQLADTIRKAFTIAKSGRPGPVLVDVPKDVTAAKCEYIRHTITAVEPKVDTIRSEDVDTAAQMIAAAKKPFIFVGGGAVIADASEEVRALAHKIQAPVCDSLMGKGAFSGEDELYTGPVGMHGTKTSNYAMCECDLLITLGARFSDRVTGDTKTFAPKAKILQIDVDAAEINKNVTVDASVIGDLKEVLKLLLVKIPEQKHEEWVQHIQDMKEKYPLNYDHSQLTGPYVIQKLYELTGGDAIISTDVGQHQMWAAQYFKFKEPRTFLTSGGLGTMGYGLGAAIGAKMGYPDKTVVNIAGDGCFRMNMNEIATAVRCGRPLVQIILNNHVLGMVRQWQTLFYDHRYSQTVLNDGVDFVKVSEAMGAKAIRVTKMEEVEPALKMALSSEEPVVLDCWIDQDLSVYPMVPAGASLDEVFDEEDVKK